MLQRIQKALVVRLADTVDTSTAFAGLYFYFESKLF